MVCRLRGFAALAVVGIVGLGSVTGVGFAGEGMACKEVDTGGKNGSGETGQSLYEWRGPTVWRGVECEVCGLAFGASRQLFCHWDMASLRIVTCKWALVGGGGAMLGRRRAIRRRPLVMGVQPIDVWGGDALFMKSASVWERLVRRGESSLWPI